MEGERTRLVLASITPARPWSFHTAQNKRDLLPLDRRAAPVTAKGPRGDWPASVCVQALHCTHAALDRCAGDSTATVHAGLVYAGCPTGHAVDDSYKYKASTLPRGLGIASAPYVDEACLGPVSPLGHDCHRVSAGTGDGDVTARDAFTSPAMTRLVAA